MWEWLLEILPWIALIFIFAFCYLQLTLILFVRLRKKYCGVLLILAAFLPWMVGGLEGWGWVCDLLWGGFVGVVGPRGAGIVAPAGASVIPSVPIMVSLLAGGVLGLLGLNRKFFMIGGILGVAAILAWLGWVVGTGAFWLLFTGKHGICSVSFGFFVAAMGSYRLLSTTSHDVLVMQRC